MAESIRKRRSKWELKSESDINARIEERNAQHGEPYADSSSEGLDRSSAATQDPNLLKSERDQSPASKCSLTEAINRDRSSDAFFENRNEKADTTDWLEGGGYTEVRAEAIPLPRLLLVMQTDLEEKLETARHEEVKQVRVGNDNALKDTNKVSKDKIKKKKEIEQLEEGERDSHADGQNNEKKDGKGIRMFKCALVELVKNIVPQLHVLAH